MIEGRKAKVAARLAGVAGWLRHLPPEAFEQPLPALPETCDFSTRIANHLPAVKSCRLWLQSVTEACEADDAEVALWLAREMATGPVLPKFHERCRLRLVILWAWHCRHASSPLPAAKPAWSAAMTLANAMRSADDWHETLRFLVTTGAAKSAGWAAPAEVAGFRFMSLSSPGEICTLSLVMRNCLRSTGDSISQGYSQFWQVTQGDTRIGVLELSRTYGNPYPGLSEFVGDGNSLVSVEAWRAAHHWLSLFRTIEFARSEPDRDDDIHDRRVWQAIFREYWLARRRIPSWLPLRPSSEILRALHWPRLPRLRNRRRQLKIHV